MGLPEYKRHHFVPQFYLKHFSSGAQRRSITLFNMKLGRSIHGASIRKQSAKNFFYGKEAVIEDALSRHEEAIALVVRRVIDESQLPLPDTEDYASLVTFILYLRARTAKAADDLSELYNSFFKAVASKDPRVASYQGDVRIRVQNPAIQSLATMASITPIASDLRPILLKNESTIDFVTSDNPVYFENRYMEKRNVYGSHTGLASIGLRIFFPISPKFLVLLYDPEVYLLKNADSFLFEVDSDYDIWGINRLQFLGGYQNVYLSPSVTEQDALKYYKRSLAMREQSKQVFNEYKSVDNPERALFEFSSREPRSKLDLSFLRITKRAMAARLSSSMAKVRNPELYKMVEDSDSLAV